MKSGIGFFAAAAAALFLTACGRSTVQTYERQGFFFDTTVDIKVNAKNGEKLLDECFDLCAEYERVFSARNEASELYKVNHRTEQSVTVSDDLRDCVALALHYSEITDGKFDLTIFPVSELWDFHAEEPKVPDDGAISEAAAKVDYRRVHVDGNTLTFDSPDTAIDLGGVAKGYISGKLGEYLVSRNCTSALINLGGNVRAVGRKSAEKAWNIGIQKPFSDRGEIVTAVEAEDICVISSGIYERYFDENGTRYHHILDPQTGYPAETDYQQVTVIGERDADCDALATIALVAGLSEAERAAKETGINVTFLCVDLNGKLEGPFEVEAGSDAEDGR